MSFIRLKPFMSSMSMVKGSCQRSARTTSQLKTFSRYRRLWRPVRLSVTKAFLSNSSFIGRVFTITRSYKEDSLGSSKRAGRQAQQEKCETQEDVMSRGFERRYY